MKTNHWQKDIETLEKEEALLVAIRCIFFFGELCIQSVLGGKKKRKTIDDENENTEGKKVSTLCMSWIVWAENTMQMVVDIQHKMLRVKILLLAWGKCSKYLHVAFFCMSVCVCAKVPFISLVFCNLRDVVPLFFFTASSDFSRLPLNYI